MVYVAKGYRLTKKNGVEIMALTNYEELWAFDLVIFDFKKKAKEEVTCSDELIKAGYKTDAEGIGKLYYESLGYKVEEFGKKRKAPIGFPDLLIEKDGEKRGVEVKQWHNGYGVRDTIKFHQLDYFFEQEGIVLFVVYRDKPLWVDLRY